MGGETEILRLPININRGFYPTTQATGRNENKDSIRDGSNFLYIGPGLMRSARGLGVAGVSGAGGKRLFIANDAIATVNGDGSIVPDRMGLVYYMSAQSGGGIIFVNGLSFNGTGGVLRYTINSNERNAGLAAPATAPTLTAGAAGSIVSGATSCQITRVRTVGSIEGGSDMRIFEESNPSPISNIVAVQNKKIHFGSFPAAGTGLDAHDAWGIYVTDSGQGSLGPYFFLANVPESTIAASPDRSYEVDWSDSQLLALEPPTDNFQPPTGIFVAKLGDVVFIIGAKGGTYYAASAVGNYGAFPPLATASMSPSETPIGLTGRATQNELYVWTMNSLQSFALSGNPDAPIYNRAIWPSTGILSPMGGCFAHSRFYCFIAKSGPARMGSNDDPDTSFALPVRDYIAKKNWDPKKVSVGYDPVLDGIVFAHGDEALVYMQGLSAYSGFPVWCTPVVLNAAQGATNTSLITFEGQLIVGRDAGLYSWEGGLNNQSWYIVTARQDGPEPMDIKVLNGVRIHCNMDGLIAKVFIDDNDPNGTADLTLTDPRTGSHYTDWSDALWNIAYQNWTLRLEGGKKDQQIDDIVYEFMYTPGIRAIA